MYDIDEKSRHAVIRTVTLMDCVQEAPPPTKRVVKLNDIARKINRHPAAAAAAESLPWRPDYWRIMKMNLNIHLWAGMKTETETCFQLHLKETEESRGSHRVRGPGD
ncbi:Hypothetical predicted protein [Xyrichtys novacula]|uniref:Uncharacterized protein n=1 Tax=Xyrichtys novacula TaxID=13765 RepID=A0AAV1H6K7_XYRNO|nr:Hypothetical predicted protein [Xyrichtys novacula]